MQNALRKDRELDFAKFDLNRSEVLTAPDSWIGRTIRPTSGKLWITQPGDESDYFVCDSNSFPVMRPGTVVQALEDAEFRLAE